MSTLAWLIELAPPEPCVPRYVALSRDGDAFWTADHLRAFRFPTKVAASKFVAARLAGSIHVAQHEWL